MPAPTDRRISLPYTFPTSLHDRLQEEADEMTRGNRSERAERLVRLGLAAEAAGFEPSTAEQPSAQPSV